MRHHFYCAERGQELIGGYSFAGTHQSEPATCLERHAKKIKIKQLKTQVRALTERTSSNGGGPAETQADRVGRHAGTAGGHQRLGASVASDKVARVTAV